jgi:hypothetical protein
MNKETSELVNKVETELSKSAEKSQDNRPQERRIIYNSITGISKIKFDEQGRPIAYHPYNQGRH